MKYCVVLCRFGFEPVGLLGVNVLDYIFLVYIRLGWVVIRRDGFRLGLWVGLGLVSDKLGWTGLAMIRMRREGGERTERREEENASRFIFMSA